MSTGKTLHERFSWNISGRSDSKLCLHLKFLRHSAFLLCFLPFWESSWWFSKKFLATVFAFLQGLYLASSAFKDYTKSHAIVLELAKNNVAAKKVIWKKRFFRFYAKIAADTGFRVAALEQRKNITNNKKSKLQNVWLHFLSLFFNFRTLVRNIFDHWHNFFYSHYFCFKFGRVLLDANVKIYCNFQTYCVWYWKYDILHVKNDQNFPIKSTDSFLYFPKNLRNSCTNIFTNVGSWPTFSVPNEFF